MRTTFCLVLLFFVASAQAGREPILNPVGAALGGAGRAAVSPTDGASLNPASIAHLSHYHAVTSFDNRQKGENSEYNFGIHFTDAGEDAFMPASISYVKGKVTTGRAEMEQSQLGVSFASFVGRNVSLGMSFRRWVINPLFSEGHSSHNFDWGLLFIPIREIGIGIVFNDIFWASELDSQPTASIGIHYIFKEAVRFRLDLLRPDKHNPDNKLVFMSGVESVLPFDFKFRAGWQWNQYLGKHIGTTGLGWDGPRLAFDYAYQKDIGNEEFRHLVDLRLQF